jgi:hypothetical protein
MRAVRARGASARAVAVAGAIALAAGGGAGCSRADGEGTGVSAPAGATATGAAATGAPATGAPAAATTAATAEPPAKRPPPRPAALTRVTIKALGMYCEESCPVKVRFALADITSVYELGFDLSKESVFISYDASLGPAKQVTKPMIAAIKQAGFDPWLARESWPEGAEARVVAR